MKNYAKSPIYQLLKISSLELNLRIPCPKKIKIPIKFSIAFTKIGL
jgi:hypothetical protein